MNTKRTVYRVEQRKPEGVLPLVQSWLVYDELDSYEAAEASLAELRAYDAYYSCTGWEQRIQQATVKTRN